MAEEINANDYIRQLQKMLEMQERQRMIEAIGMARRGMIPPEMGGSAVQPIPAQIGEPAAPATLPMYGEPSMPTNLPYIVSSKKMPPKPKKPMRRGLLDLEK